MMANGNELKKLTLTFLGGVEENVGTRSMNVEIPNSIRKMTDLIKYLYEDILKDNPGREMLLYDESTVKPGILVLHNNRDINMFDQATVDDQDELSDDDESARFQENSFQFQERCNNAKEQEHEKLRINDGDEISFLSIIHGG